MRRREFLLASAAIPALAAGPKRLAAIITEYRLNSHAEVICGKYFDGYRQDGKSAGPRSRIISMYTHQVPANDLSRKEAKDHNVPIASSIEQALTFGTGKLAVDGVLLIGEHGKYPDNEKGQKLYPRYELFTEITNVFRKTGKSVPLFSDKHLSYSWANAKRMVEISRELKFPMMAGSSVPVAYRIPQVEAPYGKPIRKAVAVAYGDLEAYGYHMLESLQCLVERRKGAETGVAAVECLENDAVWRWLDQNQTWAQPLFDAAIGRSETRKAGDLRSLARKPALFLVDYRDGLKAAGFLLNGALEDFNVAVQVEGEREPLSMLMWLEHGRPYHHFACLVQNVEKMFESGKATYPVERTLLVSGVLDFLMDSRFRGHVRIETPDLQVKYDPGPASHFCRERP